MTKGQLVLAGYGIVAGAAYIVSVIRRAWRRQGGEG